MSARLAVLAAGPRRALAVALVAASLLAPGLAIWAAASATPGRAAERTRLTDEIADLSRALDARLAQPGVTGAPVAATSAAAERALTRQADHLARALEEAGARVTRREGVQPVDFAGVAELRLSLEADGSAAALGDALAQLAEDEPVGVQFLDLIATGPGQARLRLVLVQVLAGERSDAD